MQVVLRCHAMRSLQHRDKPVGYHNRLFLQIPGLILFSARPLHTPADDPSQAKTAIQHFHDKLIHIHDRLKTRTGKLMGDKRHKVVSLQMRLGCKSASAE